jgi:IMP cyclohydrolase
MYVVVLRQTTNTMTTTKLLPLDHWVEEHLRKNTYPGRMIVVGMNHSGDPIIVYAIMGRSASSRDRCFVHDASHPNNTVSTATASGRELSPDEAALIIYPAVATKQLSGGRVAIFVTNGEQTKTLINDVEQEGDFMRALEIWPYEPDSNRTPRISAMITMNEKGGDVRATLSMIKPQPMDSYDPPRAVHHYWGLPSSYLGNRQGWMITTYAGDGNPLPPFPYGPLPVPIIGDTEAVARYYWDALDKDNRVALVVRTFQNDGTSKDMSIINGYSSPKG